MDKEEKQTIKKMEDKKLYLLQVCSNSRGGGGGQKEREWWDRVDIETSQSPPRQGWGLGANKQQATYTS